MSGLTREQRIERLQRIQALREKMGAQDSSQDVIAEEMHPAFSTVDRTVVKNLGNQADEGSAVNVDYLKNKYPDLDVKSQDGRIIARTKGEKGPWKVLDPDTGFFSADMARDALDIAWPVAQGVAEGAAAAAGAAGGLGVGSVPGAMIGGASAATAGEGLRQALANALGLQKGVSGEDFAWSIAPNVVLPAGGALLGAAKRNVFPAVAGTLSGVGKEAVDITMKRLKEMDALESRPLYEAQRDFNTQFKEAMQNYLDKPNAKLKDALNSSPEMVDLSKVAAPIEARIAELETLSKDLPTDAIKSEIGRMKSFMKGNFMRQPRNESFTIESPIGPKAPSGTASVMNPDDISYSSKTYSFKHPHMPLGTVEPFSAWELQQRIGDLADYAKFSPYRDFKVRPEREWTRLGSALDEMYDEVGKSLSKATEGTSQEAKDEMARALRLRGQLGRYFSTPESSYSALTNFGSKSNTMLRGMAEDFKKMSGVDIQPTADIFFAQSRLGDKVPGGLSYIPVSGQGSTSTSRNLMLQGGAAPIKAMLAAGGGGIGGTTAGGAALGVLGALGLPVATSPRAVKQYIRMMSAWDDLAKNKAFDFGSKAATRSAWHLLDPKQSLVEQ